MGQEEAFLREEVAGQLARAEERRRKKSEANARKKKAEVRPATISLLFLRPWFLDLVPRAYIVGDGDGFVLRRRQNSGRKRNRRRRQKRRSGSTQSRRSNSFGSGAPTSKPSTVSCFHLAFYPPA